MPNPATEAPTILFVHGLWMGGWSMSWLSHKLREAGFSTEALTYDSFTGLPKEHIGRLAQAVASFRGTVHLVGHSMGGVVVLHYLLGTPRPAATGRAVLLGAPARGSQAALAFERQPWGPALLGNSLDLWRSTFAERIDDGLEVGAIAGSEPFGLGPLFVALPPPSDGVVTVEETRIPGLRDHIVLPVSHTGMLFSNAVARQLSIFLQQGRFER
jgi:pimeloyl-ACP methyl ester carboxylesterase